MTYEEQFFKNDCKKTVTILNSFLKVDANSTSCCIAYQPKTPKGIERFRKIK
ncbi:MAG: cyclic lactone autoinducer peptide [Roseburia sp.]|nr:cyclic lactone autoinducer peptide [Roseburia sp.]